MKNKKEICQFAILILFILAFVIIRDLPVGIPIRLFLGLFVFANGFAWFMKIGDRE